MNGFGLSKAMDSHIYALDGGNQIALIDCGMGTEGSIDMIIKNMQDDGLDPKKVNQIFITHYHIDHCGGLAAWQERFSIKAYIDESVVDAIHQSDTKATGFRLAQQDGVYPMDYVFKGGRIDVGLKGSDKFKIGRLNLEFIPTPGHCNGHGSYLVTGARKYLFTGDCVFAGGKIALLNTEDCDLAKYRETILLLDTLDFDALLPGHGAIALSGGKEHVRIVADAFRTLSLPRSMT
jgi:glyoxylase-like metal-dependent hydrolase (beta-lactamase superfamily II)